MTDFITVFSAVFLAEIAKIFFDYYFRENIIRFLPKKKEERIEWL